ncbi:AAA family ATPase [Erythrobacter westpacificensis]
MDGTQPFAPLDAYADEFREAIQEAKESAGSISATPFGWMDPAEIAPRRWLFGKWLLRGEITAIVAPGGLGKSTLTTAISLSLASGQDFLGKGLPEGARATWLWNLEDDADELARQVSACGIQHGIGAADCGGRLFVDSGLDQALCTAVETPTGLEIVEPIFDALRSEIERRKIDALIVDPFVSSHRVSENDNGKIDAVAKRWKRLAADTGAAIILVHHSKKMGGRETRAEDSRGAVSLINVARSTLVLNPMTGEEAERFGIADRAEQRAFVRVEDDKPNRAPAEGAMWFRKVSVSLPNGDSVGAAVQWTPPNAFDGISVRDLYEVQQRIAAGEWAENVQANDWAGHAVAQVIGADLDDKADKARVKSLLRTWIENGALKVERRPTRKGREKPFLIVGKPVEPADLPTSKSEVGNSGEIGAKATSPNPPHPTPYKGGGGGGGVGRQSEAQGGVNPSQSTPERN